MIRRTVVSGGQQTEFYLEVASPVSVIGAFNGWSPEAGAMQVIGNDHTARRSWTTHLEPGRHPFRYLDADGNFFDDAEADAYEPNGYGGFHGVIVVPEDAGTDTHATPTEHKAAPERATKRATTTSRTTPATSRKDPLQSPRRAPARASTYVDLVAGQTSADDRAIEAMFQRALAAHPYLADTTVRCAVIDHVAHLEGTVRSRLAKQALWDLAWSLRAIRDVHASVVIEDVDPRPAPSISQASLA